MNSTTTGHNAPTSFGLSVALLTPFDEKLNVEYNLAIAHANWVLENGADSITLFGTTGEGASLNLAERLKLVDGILASGIAPTQIIPCIKSTSVPDATKAIQPYQQLGIRKILIAPPFYYKGVSDEGLLNWFSALIDAVGDPQLRLILYHIPQLTMVGISPSLVVRLRDRYGRMIFGIKDSSGDTQCSLAFLQLEDMMVAIGDERLLADLVERGVSGAVSGMANAFPKQLGDIIRTATHNLEINKMTTAIVQEPVTPGVKALVAAVKNDPRWLAVRPPLETASPSHQDKLLEMANAAETHFCAAVQAS